MVREISWTHNVVILERCKDDPEREFYIRMTRKYGWSKTVLIHHVENRSYEKTLLGQTNFKKSKACLTPASPPLGGSLEAEKRGLEEAKRLPGNLRRRKFPGIFDPATREGKEP